jgi:SAM-dependent methyltransferase
MRNMNPPKEAPRGLRLDLGCGSTKKEGTIGLDIQPLPGVDHVLDMESQPLPFADRSVEYVYSSHFLEHTVNPGNIFVEVGRVCRDGAQLEFWTPYAWHNDAFLFEHKTFFTEEHYLHMCVLFPDFWQQALRSRWVLNEVQYVIPEDVLNELAAQNISVAFAVKHLHNIVKEFGVHITVWHQPPSQVPFFRRTYSTSRTGPRYDIDGIRDEGTREDVRVGTATGRGRPVHATPHPNRRGTAP